jgi:hypothetical protein
MYIIISYAISYLLKILFCVYPPFSLGLFVSRSRLLCAVVHWLGLHLLCYLDVLISSFVSCFFLWVVVAFWSLNKICVFC